RDGLLPARVGVVVIEPDAVDLEVAQGLAERSRPGLPVARVGRADALPAVGRWAGLAVGTYGYGVGVVPEVGLVVHRVELGEDLRPLPFQPRHAIVGQSAGADPDGIDAIVGQ